MAAATENTARVEDVEGNRYVTRVNVTWGNGDTFASNYSGVQGYSFEPTTAAAHGITVSGGTLTLVSGGSLTGELMVRSDGTG